MTGEYSGGDYQNLGNGLDGALGDGGDFGIDYFEVNPGNDSALYRPGTGVEVEIYFPLGAGLDRATRCG